ncbi:hypothetical protein ACNQR9_06935 [Mycolicibacterium peregrinum]
MDVGPDFSMVDSLEKAEELYAQGQLERMLLFPTEFGGQDFPQNVVYVPVGFTAAKAEIDNNVISPLIRDGKVQAYSDRARIRRHEFHTHRHRDRRVAPGIPGCEQNRRDTRRLGVCARAHLSPEAGVATEVLTV